MYMLCAKNLIEIIKRPHFFVTLRNSKLIIPPDYTGTINVDLNVLANDVIVGGYKKWIGKKVRFIEEVDYKPEEGDELHVNPDFDIFEFGEFDFVISGFDRNSNEIGKYKRYRVYTFTVKIESFDPSLDLITFQSMNPRLIVSIIDE